jgi:hypothetical protein
MSMQTNSIPDSRRTATFIAFSNAIEQNFPVRRYARKPDCGNA